MKVKARRTMTCGRIRKLDKLGNMKKDLTFETAKKKGGDTSIQESRKEATAFSG